MANFEDFQKIDMRVGKIIEVEDFLEARVPAFKIKVDTDLNFNSDFGALGWYVGKQVKNKIPFFTGIKNANTDQLKEK